MFSLRLLALIFVSTDEAKDEDVQAADRKEGALWRGDLLVVPRTLFTHFGIYLGGGR